MGKKIKNYLRRVFMNNKQHYKSPTVCLFAFYNVDVITASACVDGDYLMEDIFYGAKDF